MRWLHPLERSVLDYIRHEQLLPGEMHALAAVSGGPDSLALLHVLLALQDTLGLQQITVLHFDHQLRAESRGEAEFVEALAKGFGLEFLLGTEDVLSVRRQHGMSLEMAARVCRHRFFMQSLDQVKARSVALGHTATDQAEEILLRLFRGTGPSGLSGMQPKTAEGIIRPLLFATRREVLSYLRDCGLSYRQDASNLDPFCQRNALRVEVFPLLEKHFHSKVEATLTRHAQLVRDEEAFWGEHLQGYWRKVCTEETPESLTLSVPELLLLHTAPRRRILRMALERLQGNLLGIYAVHVESLCRLIAEGSSGKIIHLPGGLYGLRGEGSLTLSKGISQPSQSFLEQGTQSIESPGTYVFGGSTFTLRVTECSPHMASAMEFHSSNRAYLDDEKILWPLSIRFRRRGDCFRPLGFPGTKKLQDFFVDAKIPRSERDRIPILCDEEKICWVVGLRPDDRVKVTGDTRRVLVVEKKGKLLFTLEIPA